eukprot:1519173-Prymnesium_polylepis.1
MDGARLGGSASGGAQTAVCAARFPHGAARACAANLLLARARELRLERAAPPALRLPHLEQPLQLCLQQ